MGYETCHVRWSEVTNLEGCKRMEKDKATRGDQGSRDKGTAAAGMWRKLEKDDGSAQGNSGVHRENRPTLQETLNDGS